jgi:hypothetical protein
MAYNNEILVLQEEDIYIEKNIHISHCYIIVIGNILRLQPCKKSRTTI